MTDTCTKCNENPVSNVKVVMYYANSEPVYYKLCDKCIQDKWMKVKIDVKRKVSRQ